MTDSQAFDAIVELIDEVKSFVLATVDTEGTARARWMGGMVADPAEPGLYYMVCGAESRKVAQIAANPAVELLFSSKDWSRIANIRGTAALVSDVAVKRMVWDAMPAAAHYFAGPDDPNYAVLSFRAECAELVRGGEGSPVKVDWCRE